MVQHFLQSEKLSAQTEIGHFFSTKHAGFQGAHPIYEHFKLHESQLVLGQQIHGCGIAIVDQYNHRNDFKETDALITCEPGICIVIKTADCTPVLLYDPEFKVVAAIHSGWRGTIQNIVGASIRCMEETFGCQSSNIIAAIGPSIGVKRYEVGEEVAILFRKNFPPEAEVVNEPVKQQAKARVNVSRAVYHQLLMAGISCTNIEHIATCTFDHPDFWSARRHGSSCGRMINGIFLKK